MLSPISNYFTAITVSGFVHFSVILTSSLWWQPLLVDASNPKQSILLELNQPQIHKVFESAQQPQSSAVIEKFEAVETKNLVKQAEAKNLEALLQTKELEIDRKIRSIRRALHRAVSASSLFKQVDLQVLSNEKSGPALDEYLNKIRNQVLPHWYPQLVQLEGVLSKSEARLDFVVTRNGEVLQYSIVDWKGNKQFRDLCLNAFRESLPFGKLPNAFWRSKKEAKFVLSLFFYYQ